MVVTIPPRAFEYRDPPEEFRLSDQVSRAEKRRFLRLAFECPLRILDEGLGDGDGLQRALDRQWRNWCAQKYEVDGEVPEIVEFDEWSTEDQEAFLATPSSHSSPIQTLDDYLGFSYEELEDWEGLDRAYINVMRWYPAANRAFRKTIQNFIAEVVDPLSRPKHYPGPGDHAAKDLAEKSRRTKESVLCFGLTPNVLGGFAREQESEVFDRLWDAAEYRGMFNCITTVGYVEGQPSIYLAIQWSPRGIHAYPVSQAEYQRDGDTYEIMSDSLQGFARRNRRAGTD